MATARAPSPAPRWELYRLLGEPLRLRLLALASLEELAVGELAILLDEGQPKISRQAAALRDAGLLAARKQGTWVLLQLRDEARADPVVKDALDAGLELTAADGTRARVTEVVRARDGATREFFARRGHATPEGPPDALAAYLGMVAHLLDGRRLAVDAGTGDGALLEVVAPMYERVVALDRSEAQLERARARAKRRGLDNVRFVCGEVDGPEIAGALAQELAGPGRGKAERKAGADAVFAARLLHHAPVPTRAFAELCALCRPATRARPGGTLVLLDYERHDDESMRADHADLWLGFAPDELARMARAAGLGEIRQDRVPPAWRGHGPDHHLRWQLLSGRRK